MVELVSTLESISDYQPLAHCAPLCILLVTIVTIGLILHTVEPGLQYFPAICALETLLMIGSV